MRPITSSSDLAPLHIHDGEVSHAAPRLPSLDQRVPPTIQSTNGQIPEGGTTMMVEDGGAGTRQQREFLVRLEKRIPLTAESYNLYHLTLDYHTVKTKLQSLDCSLTLAPDIRAVGSTTLLTANDFLIPILEEVWAGASISKNFIRAWGQVEPGVADRRFLEVAVMVIKYGSPRAKQCYEKEVRLCGRMIELIIMLHGLDNWSGHPNM